MIARRWWGGVWRAGIDYLLPPRCPGCGAIVDGDHRFCAPCWRSLDFLGDPCCPCCALPLPHPGAGPCGACHADPPPFARAAAAVVYGAVARTVALRLKHGGRPEVARTMARLMVRLVRDAPADALVVAVPLHRWRLWSRGYNQALLIARALSAQTGHVCLPDALVRHRATPMLGGLGRKARARAVAGAFGVPHSHRSSIEGRTVLLVDDVYTSGATAGACARALRRAGAAEVRLLCWARVLPERAGR